MTLEEYFAQDKYFSESDQELKDLDDLPYPHLFNAWRKLHVEHGQMFIGSRLSTAFIERLSPSPERIRENLKKYGKTAHLCLDGNTTPVRSKLYHAAKVMGAKVSTHRDKAWVTAEIKQVPGTVRVRGEHLAT